MTAYKGARKGKRYRSEVTKYHANLEENILNLHNHLVWGSWQPNPPRCFTIMEPKMRMITAPPFEDRIVHHALVRKVSPIFEQRFIHRSYACLKGKGVHRAIQDLQKGLQRMRRKHGQVWVVQADISKYFASVNHQALFSQISIKVKCPRTLDLWWRITQAYGFDEEGRGIPVGALTSQLDANINLDPIDHALTDDLAAPYYARYMDDIVILCRSKDEARFYLSQLKQAVEAIGLQLNPKTQIRQAAQGVDWCGYRTWSTHILPRKRNIKRMKAKIKRATEKFNSGRADIAQLKQAVDSILAYTKHCDAHKTINSIIGDIKLCRSSKQQKAA